VTLQGRLDAELRRRGARDAGICPVREELYAGLLDELVRQVTVHCAERGLALVAVRDELAGTARARVFCLRGRDGALVYDRRFERLWREITR
jgi:dynein light intermediate chain